MENPDEPSEARRMRVFPTAPVSRPRKARDDRRIAPFAIASVVLTGECFLDLPAGLPPAVNSIVSGESSF